MSKTFIVKANSSGGFDMTPYQRATLKDFIKESQNRRIRLTMELVSPESNNQRKFYHGAVLPLWAYLDGRDYKDSIVLDQLHEIAKREFNGEIVIVGGKQELVGKSTKGMLSQGYLDKIIEFLEEQYGIDPGEVLNVDLYKKFRDHIYGFGEVDTFIDYMKKLKIL